MLVLNNSTKLNPEDIWYDLYTYIPQSNLTGTGAII